MQISAYTSIKSFKGSPYWMAPEVKATAIFWCIFSLVSWTSTDVHLFPRLSWIPMDIAFQLTFGALAAPFLRWQLQGLLGVSMKGCVCCEYTVMVVVFWWLSAKLSLSMSQVAAIFKIGNSKDIPDIPDHLSSEAKSFLKLCLQRDPAARPTAAQLIEHPWVKDQASVRGSRSGVTRDMFPTSIDGNKTTVHIYNLWLYTVK